jgi:rSAM/selenodomain-associated transferase 1
MRQLGVFAKYWEPGAVKTRLAAAIGSRRAARLYQAFLVTTLRRMETRADRRVLAYTPLARRDEFLALAGQRWVAWDQGSGDLGQRIGRFFVQARQQGSLRTVLIGSDSPTLPLEILDDAFLALEQTPVVLGPSSDGGYYLVGIAGDAPLMFHGISWSSADVWQQTVRRLDELKCPYRVLPAWYDVDELQQLLRLQAELDDLPPGNPVLEELRHEIRRSLEERRWKTM